MPVISGEIQCMAAEEVYDWFGKATHGRTVTRAEQSFRVLLAEE